MFGRRHQDSAVAAQPAPIVKSILSDDAHAGRRQILHPREDLRRIEVLAVGMTDRKVVRADFAIGAVSNADTTDIAVTERPARPAVCQPFISGLSIERDDPGAT